MDKKALIEVGKSFLRFVWFGLLALVGTFLTNLVASGQLDNIVVDFNGLAVNLSVVVLAVITGIIKLLDKYVHESKNIDSNGLAPSILQK
jgi:hypothetical protein